MECEEKKNHIFWYFPTVVLLFLLDAGIFYPRTHVYGPRITVVRSVTRFIRERDVLECRRNVLPVLHGCIRSKIFDSVNGFQGDGDGHFDPKLRR